MRIWRINLNHKKKISLTLKVEFKKTVDYGVPEMYSKYSTSLRWSGAHWRKLFSIGGNEKKYKICKLFHWRLPENCVEFNYSIGTRVKTTQDANYSTGALIQTTQDANYSTEASIKLLSVLITPLEPEYKLLRILITPLEP